MQNDTFNHIIPQTCQCDVCHQVYPMEQGEVIYDSVSNMKICKSCRNQKLAQEQKILTPIEVFNHLEKHVIGQTAAKRVISVAVCNHLKRIHYGGIKKSNILMVGPTGSGKTLLAKTMADYLNLPFAMADASSLTEAGYIGSDIETILSRLLCAAQGDINLAQKGIVFIDEIDKIAQTKDIIGKDLGSGVQHGLLKILEGSLVRVPLEEGQGSNGEYIIMDTSNILFICGGAFPALEQIVKNRCNVRTVGFRTKSSEDTKTDCNWQKNAITKDFEDFGFISEFLGRLPIKVFLNPITKEDLTRILTEPEDSIIKEYQRIFSIDNTELTFTRDALDAIADKALSQGTGARGLRTILEEILLETAFTIPSIKGNKRVVIDESIVNGAKTPFIQQTNSNF